jgi:hypothetical protein
MTALKNMEEDPEDEDYPKKLEKELSNAGAGKDEELLNKAKELLKQLKEDNVITEQTYKAVLKGDGAIAQGNGAIAAGKGGIAVGGNVNGGIRIGGKDEK